MIPIHLRIAGFLSYQEPVDLDFDSFNLACISGQNGAGKSSLLDAFTWALFGKARGKSADVINLNANVKAAEVALTFRYEGNTYRVLRKLPRGKSTTLEFQIQADDDWRPLTEKSTSETQTRIEQTLRLDYETFINASFFLQGKADQFTQKKASERKAILSSILGLEIWDEYKERAAEKRKGIEDDIREVEGRIAEIDGELAEESARKSRLAELEKSLAQLSSARATQESALENIRRNAALVSEQKKLAATLSAALERSRAALAGIESRLAEKESARALHADLISRAKQIESAYRSWQKTRKQLEELDAVASQFREYDEQRQPLLREVEVERAKLEQERETLKNQQLTINDQLMGIGKLEEQVEAAKISLSEVEEKIKERAELETRKNDAREKAATLKAENESLRKEMDALAERIKKLEETSESFCPVCGQELTESHRAKTIEDLTREGTTRGDQFRENKKDIENIESEIAAHQVLIAKLTNAENERVKYSNAISQLNERVGAIQSAEQDWKSNGEKRLQDVTLLLENESFAEGARKQLKSLDKELAKLGYDVSAHGAKRKEELDMRAADEEYRKLDTAREVIKQIESEIKSQTSETESRKSEIATLESEHQSAKKNLEATESSAPDLNAAERALFSLREEENETREQVGGAQQKVQALTALRARKSDYEQRRGELAQQAMRYKILERSFSKDGVPALLIEQALPQIQDKANSLLERLSDGQMSVRFSTLEEYKDKKREDKKETLEIQISDGSGMRDYEMYSGGEAFRINFAIRLALSEILAQRKGARLQTLVIDEGFGSQDALGRLRLVEAINLVKHDFAKILVITHLDELKDMFPNRIEVEKTERGSAVKVI